MQCFEQASAKWHRFSHYDTFAYTVNFIFLAIERSIKQVVGRFLEWGQHQNTFFHFRQTAAGYTQYLALVSHQVGKQHYMSYVYTHAVRWHSIIYFFNYCRSSCFNSNRLKNFYCTVWCCFRTVNSLKLKIIAFL